MSSLDPAAWKRVEAAFDRLLDLTGPARVAELERITALEPGLRPHLDALLQGDARGGGPLERPAALLGDLVMGGGAAPAEGPLPDVPRYRILREIGRGGMGTVYLAERSDGQFEQTAALKVLRAGMNTEEITRRFLLERRILARLEHPGIAHLLDGGVTADGRPYFVMDHVDGRPITAFADSERLDVDERTALFVEVCAAVAHAQRHLIVHRDLKPSNILVTAAREVKLLDFGIAKPLDLRDVGGVDLTRTGVHLATPAYAAPEQLRGEPVTTATDVYALGVLLYELLSGRRPYRVAGTTPGLLELAVLEQEPEPLAQAVTREEPGFPTADPATQSAASTAEIAAARRMSIKELRRQLRGELAHIVAKAMRKDPGQRYASASELLEDLENYRAGRPVIARGDSAAYRAVKFLSRHRIAVTGATLVLIALAAGLAGTAWQAREAARQAERATQVKEFLAGLFEDANPDVAPGTELSATDLLARGVERIDADLHGEPEVRAELLQLVGALYLDLGRYAAARPLLERSVALQTELFGPDDGRTIAALADLGTAAVHDADYAVAESLLTRALEFERRARGDHRAAIARRLNDLGVVRSRLADHAGAEAYYREALALDREVHGGDHPEVASDLDNIAVALTAQRRLEEAVSLLRQSLAMRRRLVAGDQTETGLSLHNLAFALREAGDTEAADSLFREVIDLRRRLYPQGHPHLAISLKALAQMEYARGHHDAADSLLAEALEMSRRLLGEHHEEVAALLNEQGMVSFGRGDLRACELRFGAALAIWEQILPPGHPTLLSVQNNLAYALRANGKYADAERHVRSMLAARLASVGTEHPLVASERVALGIVLRLDGRSGEALAELGPALSRRLDHPEVSALDVAHARFHFGAALLEVGRHIEAEPVLRAALEGYTGHLAPDAPRLAEAQCALGSCLIALDREAEAEPLLKAGLQALGPELEGRDPTARRAAGDLVRLQERRR